MIRETAADTWLGLGSGGGVWNSLVLVYLIADQGGVAVAGKLIKARPCKLRQAIGRAVKINHRPQFSTPPALTQATLEKSM